MICDCEENLRRLTAKRANESVKELRVEKPFDENLPMKPIGTRDLLNPARPHLTGTPRRYRGLPKKIMLPEYCGVICFYSLFYYVTLTAVLKTPHQAALPASWQWRWPCQETKSGIIPSLSLSHLRITVAKILVRLVFFCITAIARSRWLMWALHISSRTSESHIFWSFLICSL